MVRTLIIDDEDHVRETLTTLLTRFCPQVNIVGNANSVASGIKAIREKNPELILLDIKMDDGSGFDILEHFNTIDFKIIFVTAYEKHALEAFQFSAVDYILKPVNREKLAEAVQRAQILVQQDFNTQLSALRENINPGNKKNKKVVLKTLDNIYLLNTKDIMQCRSDGCYTIFESVDNESIMVSRILKEYDEMLSGYGFFRVHRSHLVNLQHIKRFEKQEGGSVVLTNDKKIPVSSRSRERLLNLFEEMESD